MKIDSNLAKLTNSPETYVQKSCIFLSFFILFFMNNFKAFFMIFLCKPFQPPCTAQINFPNTKIKYVVSGGIVSLEELKLTQASEINLDNLK